MRILVVGANGLFGSNVVYVSQHRGWTVGGTYHSTEPTFDIPLTQFDLKEHAAFDGVIADHEPDVVVNCAAMTDVDGCEANPEDARVINGVAPGEMAAQCEDHGIDFVHVSTDYVFDGQAGEPYNETAQTSPLQVYGRSKRAGERSVQNALQDAVIPRLSFVWGVQRSTGDLMGFPAWVCAQLRAGESVPLFTDQWVSPTRAGQAAATVLDLVVAEPSGVFHVACRSCVTPYGFGEVLAERVGADVDLLREGAMDDVERKATRPRYSCLDVGKVESILDRPQPTLEEDIEAIADVVDYI